MEEMRNPKRLIARAGDLMFSIPFSWGMERRGTSLFHWASPSEFLSFGGGPDGVPPLFNFYKDFQWN